MERVPKDLEKLVRNIQVFLDDLLEIGHIVSLKGREIEIQVDHWKLENMEELEQLATTSTAAAMFRCGSNTKDSFLADSIHISIREGRGFVRAYKASAETTGMFHSVVELLETSQLPGADLDWQKDKWDTVVLSRRPRVIQLPPAPAPTPAVVDIEEPPTVGVPALPAISPPPPNRASSRKFVTRGARWVWEATNHYLIGTLIITAIGAWLVHHFHYNIFDLSRTDRLDSPPATSP